MKVLMLEDNAPMAESICRALEARGHTVHHARLVESAMMALPVYGPFDVLLLDYELPDGTGLDLLRQAGRRIGDARTILWSGLDRTAEVEESGIRVDHVLTKDATLEALALIEGPPAHEHVWSGPWLYSGGRERAYCTVKGCAAFRSRSVPEAAGS